VVIIASFGAVFYRVATKQIPWVVAIPFVLNILFNVIFTPIQFGLKNNVLASLDILLVLVTLLWALFAIFPYMRWVSYANIPYVLWVSFATILQLTIPLLNR